MIQEGFRSLHRRLNDVPPLTLSASQQSESKPPVIPLAIDVNEVESVLESASRELLAWPQHTDGRWIERPEFDRLSGLVAKDSPTVIMLLGVPGTGNRLSLLDSERGL